mmetsp:Transcript_7986/g.21928  ORF Transcript_7986/g.21928 Transcript_7986/m.21928 type:complete len:269 (+) Transcript_7986:321-1127(+)
MSAYLPPALPFLPFFLPPAAAAATAVVLLGLVTTNSSSTAGPGVAVGAAEVSESWSETTWASGAAPPTEATAQVPSLPSGVACLGRVSSSRSSSAARRDASTARATTDCIFLVRSDAPSSASLARCSAARTALSACDRTMSSSPCTRAQRSSASTSEARSKEISLLALRVASSATRSATSAAVLAACTSPDRRATTASAPWSSRKERSALLDRTAPRLTATARKLLSPLARASRNSSVCGEKGCLGGSAGTVTSVVSARRSASVTNCE